MITSVRLFRYLDKKTIESKIKKSIIITDTKHHGSAEYPLRHVDLPVEPPAVEDPRASHPCCTVGKVGVKICYPLVRSVQLHLHNFNYCIIVNKDIYNE